MFIDFNQMPDTSRVWIYQSNRPLNNEEREWLEAVTTEFCQSWAAHGSDLRSSFKIVHDQFLILAVDELASLPSGCSIDSSVHLVQQAQGHLGVDFLDRTKVAFLQDGVVALSPLTGIKERIGKGEISKDTVTFNNLVATIKDLEKDWMVPASDSWMSKYFA